MSLFNTKIFQRITAFAISTALLGTMLVSCKAADKSDVTTINIMSWNDDFRGYMENYFIPTHKKLMSGVTINWISTEIYNYKGDVEKRLDNGEQLDIFLADETMVTDFANNDKTASLASLGIYDKDLCQQFDYTRTLAKNSKGVQMGSAFSAEPGIIIYRSDYAEKYLGITNREEMQELLSSWDTFLSTAKKINSKSKGSVKMITNSSELWKSVSTAMSGLWVTDGRLTVSDEVLTEWLDYMADLESAKAFRGSKVFSDDWYDAVNGGVFCYFSSPWLNKSVPADTAEINSIYSTAQGGKSFGKWETSLAPNGFYYGGKWLFSSTNSKKSELVGEIIKSFSCNSDFMSKLALTEVCYVNNTTSIQKASDACIKNPLFVNSDFFSVYTESAKSIELSAPSVYDKEISSLLYNQAVKYKNKEIKLDQAIYNFRYNVWKKYSFLSEKPTIEDKK